MKVKLTAIILITALILTPMAAFASPPGPPPRGHYPPPPPPPHPRYDHNDRWGDVAIGCGIGLLLGAMIVSNNSEQEQAEAQAKAAREKKVAEIRQLAKDNAGLELDHALELTAISGEDSALKTISEGWQSKGRTAFLDDRNGTANLKVTGFDHNLKIEYIFRRSESNVTVRVSEPEYQIAEERSAKYHVPIPAMPTQKFAGFDISDKDRVPTGGVVARNVAPNSPAAMAGLLNGDVITKIDVYDMKNFDCNRINAYIEGRAALHAPIKITFTRGDKTISAQVQL